MTEFMCQECSERQEFPDELLTQRHSRLPTCPNNCTPRMVPRGHADLLYRLSVALETVRWGKSCGYVALIVSDIRKALEQGK